MNPTCLRVLQVVVLMAVAFLAGTMGDAITNRQSPVITIEQTPIQKEVPAGGTLLVRYHYIRMRQCDTDVDRQIFDSRKVGWIVEPLSRSGGGTMGENSFTRAVPVPTAAAPGDAVYRLTIRYACNFIQKLFPLVIQPGDVPFVITAPR